MNYKFAFYITLVLLIISLLTLYTIKVKVDTLTSRITKKLDEVEKFFFEMNSYLREFILSSNSDTLREQFNYSVDKLVDYLKQKIPTVNVDKLRVLKNILNEDNEKLVDSISSSLNITQDVVKDYVNSIKTQIQNIRNGQNIASSINYEDSNNALNKILNNLRTRLNEKN
jgi:hypothetical protein